MGGQGKGRGHGVGGKINRGVIPFKFLGRGQGGRGSSPSNFGGLHPSNFWGRGQGKINRGVVSFKGGELTAMGGGRD